MKVFIKYLEPLNGVLLTKSKVVTYTKCRTLIGVMLLISRHGVVGDQPGHRIAPGAVLSVEEFGR